MSEYVQKSCLQLPPVFEQELYEYTFTYEPILKDNILYLRKFMDSILPVKYRQGYYEKLLTERNTYCGVLLVLNRTKRLEKSDSKEVIIDSSFLYNRLTSDMLPNGHSNTSDSNIDYVSRIVYPPIDYIPPPIESYLALVPPSLKQKCHSDSFYDEDCVTEKARKRLIPRNYDDIRFPFIAGAFTYHFNYNRYTSSVFDTVSSYIYSFLPSHTTPSAVSESIFQHLSLNSTDSTPSNTSKHLSTSNNSSFSSTIPLSSSLFYKNDMNYQSVAYLALIGVNPMLQGLGIASNILHTALNYIYMKHAPWSVKLNTSSDNLAASKLYEKYNFTQTDHIKNYYFYDNSFHDALEFTFNY